MTPGRRRGNNLRDELAASIRQSADRLVRLPRDLAAARRRVAADQPDVLLRLSAAMDVLLDPIHFSGGRTTYEGLAQGTPVVTLPSPYLRGRLSYAIYRQMAVMDCVASSTEDYVELALRLAREPELRAGVRDKILAGCGRLFEDDLAVADLERVLLELARG